MLCSRSSNPRPESNIPYPSDTGSSILDKGDFPSEKSRRMFEEYLQRKSAYDQFSKIKYGMHEVC